MRAGLRFVIFGQASPPRHPRDPPALQTPPAWHHPLARRARRVRICLRLLRTAAAGRRTGSDRPHAAPADLAARGTARRTPDQPDRAVERQRAGAARRGAAGDGEHHPFLPAHRLDRADRPGRIVCHAFGADRRCRTGHGRD